MFKTAAALSLFFAAADAEAKIRLPEQLGDHCILQQQTRANLWGTAAASSKVTVKVSWSREKFTTAADSEGNWQLAVKTPKGGYEPQTVTISDKDGAVTLSDVLIGEVWLAGGQSNMEMPLNGFHSCPVEGGLEAVLSAREWKDKVREVKIPKTGELQPTEYVSGGWVETNPVTARDFTAVGWFFATTLNSAIDVPVGIIACNWGGTGVEGWLPEEVVRSYPAGTIPSGQYEPFRDPGGWYNCCSPYIMYNGMLYPIRHYTIRGFIWYQGETNAWAHEFYPGRLATMVGIWRDLWGQGDIPFYEVELAPYIYGGDGTWGAKIREAQRKAVGMIPNSGIVTTNDLVYDYEGDQIHPCRKKEVGERLALLALNRDYGMAGLTVEGPVYRDFETDGDKLIVNFSNTRYDGLSPWHDIKGFEIAGEDRVFYPARAERKDGSVVLECPEVPAPVAVRYCFKDFQTGNLTGSMGLPAAPFRSDDW